MYIEADKWEPAYRIAVSCMDSEEVHELYVNRAKMLEEEGRLKEAERLYVLVNEPDLAISMYKNNEQVSMRSGMGMGPYLTFSMHKSKR